MKSGRAVGAIMKEHAMDKSAAIALAEKWIETTMKYKFKILFNNPKEILAFNIGAGAFISPPTGRKFDGILCSDEVSFEGGVFVRQFKKFNGQFILFGYSVLKYNDGRCIELIFKDKKIHGDCHYYEGDIRVETEVYQNGELLRRINHITGEITSIKFYIPNGVSTSSVGAITYRYGIIDP